MKNYEKQNLEKYNEVRNTNYKINTEPFRVRDHNGNIIEIIKNPKELIKSLETMDEKVFNHHATNKNGKSDFSIWIKETFGNPELAEELEGAKTTKEALEILKPYKSYDWYESKFKTPKT